MEHSERILRIQQVSQILAISRSQIYAKLDRNSPSFDPGFPVQIRLGNTPRSGVGWLQSEITSYMTQLAGQRDSEREGDPS